MSSTRPTTEPRAAPRTDGPHKKGRLPRLLGQPSVQTALIAALAAALLLIVTWFATLHTATGQRWDTSILRGFVDLGHRLNTQSLATRIARLCNPKPWVYLCAFPVCL